MVFKKKAASQRRAVAAVKGAARRHYASRGGAKGIVGSFKPTLDGALGQMAASIGNQFMPPWGGIAGLTVTGYLMKNETLMTIGGMHAAAQFPVASLISGSSTNNNNSGSVI